MADDSTNAAVRVRSSHGCLKADSICSLPDVILQHILSFIPTKFAIRTSLLSRRWRHVWCDTPSLSFYGDNLKCASVNESLTRYTAPKMMYFHLGTIVTRDNARHVESLIKLAIARNVETLSLRFFQGKHTVPDFFYNNPTVKQLILGLYDCDIIPTRSVLWTSLKKLSLRGASFSDESFDKILSGCPILESLELFTHFPLSVIDLSNKSVYLRTLDFDIHLIKPNARVLGPTKIVAPHIHCLILKSELPCILADVSSLIEAKVDIYSSHLETFSKAELFQVMLLKMLEKLQNAEKLTFGGNFLQILSLAEIRGLTYPMMKVKDLTFETSISQYVIHGIERILQNSPDLKKLTIHTRHRYAITEKYLDDYVDLQGLNAGKCWRSKDGVAWNKSHWDVEPKHVASFMELMLKNTKTLEKMVVHLEERYLKFKELVRTLSHNSSTVSIVLLITPSIR